MKDFDLFFVTKTETWFVKKNWDELTKNHKDPEQKVPWIMPENCNDRLCPVRSFRKYIEHLNPKNSYLLQTLLQNGHQKSQS